MTSLKLPTHFLISNMYTYGIMYYDIWGSKLKAVRRVTVLFITGTYCTCMNILIVRPFHVFKNSKLLFHLYKLLYSSVVKYILPIFTIPVVCTFTVLDTVVTNKNHHISSISFV